MKSAIPSINYEELDPGVRRLVRALREHNFMTTDSGDGRTKPEDERTFGDRAHVAMVPMNANLILSESNRLRALILQWLKSPIVLPDQPDPDSLHEINSSYDPKDRSVVIILFDVTDEMLVGLESSESEEKDLAAKVAQIREESQKDGAQMRELTSKMTSITSGDLHKIIR
jgi:hypothetical protein